MALALQDVLQNGSPYQPAPSALNPTVDGMVPDTG